MSLTTHPATGSTGLIEGGRTSLEVITSPTSTILVSVFTGLTTSTISPSQTNAIIGQIQAANHHGSSPVESSVDASSTSKPNATDAVVASPTAAANSSVVKTALTPDVSPSNITSISPPSSTANSTSIPTTSPPSSSSSSALTTSTDVTLPSSTNSSQPLVIQTSIVTASPSQMTNNSNHANSNSNSLAAASNSNNIFDSQAKLFPVGIVVSIVVGLLFLVTSTVLFIRTLRACRRRRHRLSAASFIASDPMFDLEPKNFETITTNLGPAPGPASSSPSTHRRVDSNSSYGSSGAGAGSTTDLMGSAAHGNGNRNGYGLDAQPYPGQHPFLGVSGKPGTLKREGRDLYGSQPVYNSAPHATPNAVGGPMVSRSRSNGGAIIRSGQTGRENRESDLSQTDGEYLYSRTRPEYFPTSLTSSDYLVSNSSLSTTRVARSISPSLGSPVPSFQTALSVGSHGYPYSQSLSHPELATIGGRGPSLHRGPSGIEGGRQWGPEGRRIVDGFGMASTQNTVVGRPSGGTQGHSKKTNSVSSSGEDAYGGLA